MITAPPPAGVRRLGLLAGSFNPPTRAHLALAEAAFSRVDHVMLVLPGVLPHKTWEGASREQREGMLRVVTEGSTGLSAAVSEGGLFIDMVREARGLFPEVDFYLICGRDAAERIIGWDYGDENFVEQMLREFRMLVAARWGGYEPPANAAHAVEVLEAGDWDEVSSTALRLAVAAGRHWEHLVPERISRLVREIYGWQGP